MKILITGATGFIGKHLVKRLLADGHTVLAIVRPNSDTAFLDTHNVSYFNYNANNDSLFSYLQAEQPDGIMHLASKVVVEHTSNQIDDIIGSNILFPTHLLEAAVKANVKWFINTGTFWQHYENNSYSPVNLYAASKQSFEDIARYYFESSNINFVTFKLSDTFGPNDNRPKIVNLWIQSALSGETLEMSAGEQIIDISYIDNIVDGFLTLSNLISSDFKRAICGKSFVIKSEKRLSLKELAQVFTTVTGLKPNITWGKKTYRKREVMQPWQDGETIPGFTPKVSLEEGIKLAYKNIDK
ncbi:MAG: NAD(P)-dependent oxidoreductase [Bacteroidia bacterium]